MTKTRLVSVLAALCLIAAPSVALAQRDSGQSHKRSKKHQVHKKFKKAKVRQVVGSSASTTTPSSTTPPPSPATTASITKFDTTTGDLTITLSNGKAYTATVTNRTEIDCQSGALPTARAADHGDDNNEGDGNRGSNSQVDNPSNNQVDNRGRGNDDDSDDDQNDDGDEDDNGTSQVACDQTALTPGTQVTEAELRIDAAGSTWKKLELVK
jgi:Ni/Co efflux regulator RcnB